MGIDTNDLDRLDCRKLSTTIERKIVTVPRRKVVKRGNLNPAIISLALVSYIILSNRSLMTIVNIQKVNEGLELRSNERSLITLVSASPAPEPAPASGRSATSGSHRIPPMNGSIFGKRSVDGSKVGSNPRSKGNENIYEHANAPRIDSQSSSKWPQQNEHMLNSYPSDLRPTKTTQPTKSEATNYKDIITDMIEEFLASNNESDPEEASVAFCRMIVYECSQMLSSRSQTAPRRKPKKIYRS